MKKIIMSLLLPCLVCMSTACDDFVSIDAPRTALIRTTVFENDETAEAAMIDIYYQLKNAGFASGSLNSLSLVLSWSSDEQLHYYVGAPLTMAQYSQFNDNALQADNTIVARIWLDLYACIYKCNVVLEGLNASTKISASVKKQLLGEARFLRAFCNFYLVNLWGDVPLVTTTDYRVNAAIPRTAQMQVYAHIKQDLIWAQENLPVDYAFSNEARVRANAWAATALLARTHLYLEDWQNAILQATAVIDQTGLYALQQNVLDVFNVNSTEPLLQWWSNTRPNERVIFRFTNTPLYGAIREEFMNAFELNDNRAAVWSMRTPAGFYRTQKYNTIADNPPTQYSTVIRLAELYLIRAEAFAHQNEIDGAQADINMIRARAGLSQTTASDQASLLEAIEQERRSEFFNEWGHRWFDLKRTNRSHAVLASLKPSWSNSDELFPIPESELLNNAALQGHQNPGY